MTEPVDLTEFEELSEQHPSNKRACTVGKAIPKLGQQDRDALNVALATDRTEITASAIVAWFDRRGLRVSLTGVGTHRAGKCSCVRRHD